MSQICQICKQQEIVKKSAGEGHEPSTFEYRGERLNRCTILAVGIE